MKTLLVVAAIAATGAGASAQSGMATAPMDRSTGPTVPDTGPVDTRKIDQNIATVPSDATGPLMTAPHLDPQNWRTSSGLNADPDNPSGAPGPSTGTSRVR